LIVFNLSCAADHRFEGWFASGEDFEAQRGRGLLACPLCGSPDVTKQLSAPRLNLLAQAGDRREQHAHDQGTDDQRGRQGRAGAGGAVDQGAARAGSQGAAATQGTTSAKPVAILTTQQQQALHNLIRQVVENTEDVGEGFAEEARRIHYNETEARAIRGVATREEAEALADEGIEVAQLPVTIIDKSRLN